MKFANSMEIIIMSWRRNVWRDGGLLVCPHPRTGLGIFIGVYGSSKRDKESGVLGMSLTGA